MRIAGVIGAGLTLGGVLIWIDSGDLAPVPAGYFKGADGDRVLAYCLPGLDAAAAQRVMDATAHTVGRVTLTIIADCEDADVPGAALTGAAGLQDALALASEPPFDDWEWRGWINPAGQATVAGRER